MSNKRNILFLLGCSFLLSFIGIDTSVVEHDVHSHVHHIHEENKTSYTENVQKFEGPTGTHKVYWAQGLNAPKMTYNEEEYGKEGFFSKDVAFGDGSITYAAQMQPGNGYYDLNKNPSRMGDKTQIGDEAAHCYLNAAANVTLWWLEQNKEQVNEYVRRLVNTDIYNQPEGLVKVYPGDQSFWDSILKTPGEAIVDGYKRQESGLTDLVTTALKPYYHRYHDGFIMDKVIDFFFNGYPSDADYGGYDVLPSNNPEEYRRDPKGGYFFNIFENYQLTKRYEAPEHKKFSWYEENIRKFFAEGKAINLGYLFMGGQSAHAITIWGAEYDGNDHLVRLFATDSDDHGTFANINDEYSRGLHSMNAKKLENGNLVLGNIPDATSGVKIQSVTTISLEKDRFQARLDDTSDPSLPTIDSTSPDRIYGLNGNYKLSVDASTSDTGTLRYQWYVANSENEEGKEIAGATKKEYKIPTNEIGVKYYYCKIINQKNGKENAAKSRYFKVDVQNIELVHAQTPHVTFDNSMIKVAQYSEPTKIRVRASVDDGGTLSYQWYLSLDSMARNGTKIEGETKPYIYTNTLESRNLFYYCVVTNTNFGDNITGDNIVSFTPTYSKRLNVYPAELIDAKAPLITSHPVDAEYKINEEILPLAVEARSYDGGKLSYQWNEVDSDYIEHPIVGATGSSFKPVITEPCSKMYSVTITNHNEKAPGNKDAKITSRIVSLKINPDDSKSDENSLLTLVIENGTITPNFDPNITSYNVDVSHAVSKLSIKATASLKASIEISDTNLSYEKLNKITIKVTSESGLINTYTLNVKRDSTHEFGEWTTRVEPTESSKGLEYRTCKICGEEETREIEKLPHVHKFGDWVIIKDSTCVELGIKRRTCSCGAFEEEEIELKDHTWGEWSTRTEPTETEEGLEVRTCKVCGKEETRSLDKIPHVHKFGDWVVIKEPTTEEEGLMQRTCSCGAVETKPIPKLDKPVVPNPDVPEKPNTEKDDYIVLIVSLSVSGALLLGGAIIFAIVKNKHRK